MKTEEYADLFSLLGESLHVLAALTITFCYLLLIGAFFLWVLDEFELLNPVIRVGVFLIYLALAFCIAGFAQLIKQNKEETK